MKRFLMTCMTLVLVVSWFVFPDGKSLVYADEDIKVGVLLPLTGPWAKFGGEAMAAVELAADMVNASGGVRGKKVFLEKADTQSSPPAATSEANRLISQKGINVMIGSFAAPLGIAISGVANRRQVVHWEMFADIFTDRNNNWSFMNGPHGAVYAAAALDYIKDVLAPKFGVKDWRSLRIGSLWENRPWGTKVGRGVRARAKALKYTLKLDESYDQFMPDLTPVVLKVKSANLDFLIACSYFNDAVQFQKKARELDLYVKGMIGVSAGYGLPVLANALGKSIDGVLVSDLPAKMSKKALAPETAKLAEAFISEFTKRKGHPPGAHATGAFTTAWILFKDVLPNSKSMKPADIKTAALQLDKPMGYQITGWGVKFSNFDRPDNSKDFGYNLRSFPAIFQWQDKETHVVSPERFATRKLAKVPLPKWYDR